MEWLVRRCIITAAAVACSKTGTANSRRLFETAAAEANTAVN
jgi:hypothetical protein